MMGISDVSRRDFIRAAGAAAAAFSVGLADTRSDVRAQTAGESTDLLKVGMIGPGVQGRNVMSNCARVPGVKFTAVCDIFPDNLAKGLEIAGEGAQGFAEYRELLEKADIDAVMIAVPLNWHCEMTLAALDAGKHVFCEKMMSYSIEQGGQMVRKQRETGLVLQIGHQRRYNPTYLHALNLIEKEGVLGRITMVRALWHRNGDWRRPVPDPKFERLMNWRLYKETSQGLMAELGSHQVDVANWVLKAVPTAVVGMGTKGYWNDGRDILDDVEVLYEYPNGVKMVYSSITQNAKDDYYEQVMGDGGTLVLTHENQGLLFREARAEKLDWEQYAHKDDAGGVVLDSQATKGKGKDKDAGSEALEGAGENPYYLEMSDWVRCIRESGTPRCNATVAFESDVACLMANASIAQRRFINLPPEIYAV
jgi:predicted dehydrogenase